MMPCLVRGPANSCHGMLRTCFTNAWAMLLPGSQGLVRLRLACQGKESGARGPLAERCPPSPAAFWLQLPRVEPRMLFLLQEGPGQWPARAWRHLSPQSGLWGPSFGSQARQSFSQALSIRGSEAAAWADMGSCGPDPEVESREDRPRQDS